MKPRILHVLNTLLPSGPEVMLAQAAPYWREVGFDLAILACGPEVGYRIEHLPFRKSIGDMLQLRDRLQVLQPDLLHVHSGGMAFFVALANRASLRRPTISTVHSKFPFTEILKQRKRLERALERGWGTQYVAIGPSVAENERTRFWNPSAICPNWSDVNHFRLPSSEEVALSLIRLLNALPPRRQPTWLSEFSIRTGSDRYANLCLERLNYLRPLSVKSINTQQGRQR